MLIYFFFFFCRINADILVLLSYLPSEMVYINGACDSLLSLLGLYYYCNTFPPWTLEYTVRLLVFVEETAVWWLKEQCNSKSGFGIVILFSNSLLLSFLGNIQLNMIYLQHFLSCSDHNDMIVKHNWMYQRWTKVGLISWLIAKSVNS